MNDKPENAPIQPDLAAAIRQARMENAERAEAIADLRELQMGRLTLLESALEPIVGQAPPGVDLFDLALAKGDHPRLFIDMIAFVDLAHDRRTYRFYQDTRHGRVRIAESQSIDKIAAAVANYVARRLVERERALASDWRDEKAPALPIHESETTEAAAAPAAPRRPGSAQRLGDAFRLFLMLLGSITLALLIGLGVYVAWITRLRGLWAHWIGAPPI